MRIVIEIDGGEVTAATAQPRIAGASAAQAPAAAAASGPTPPPEVLKAAAAVGAMNAGAGTDRTDGSRCAARADSR